MFSKETPSANKDNFSNIFFAYIQYIQNRKMSINFTSVATSALGLTLALAWNDAILKILGSIFPSHHKKYVARAMLIYAVFITIFVIAIVAIINKARNIAYMQSPKCNSTNTKCKKFDKLIIL